MKNNRITFEIVESHTLRCDNCFFSRNGICHNNLCEVRGSALACIREMREDGKNVIFKLKE